MTSMCGSIASLLVVEDGWVELAEPFRIGKNDLAEGDGEHFRRDQRGSVRTHHRSPLVIAAPETVGKSRLPTGALRSSLATAMPNVISAPPPGRRASAVLPRLAVGRPA